MKRHRPSKKIQALRIHSQRDWEKKGVNYTVTLESTWWDEYETCRPEEWFPSVGVQPFISEPKDSRGTFDLIRRCFDIGSCAGTLICPNTVRIVNEGFTYSDDRFWPTPQFLREYLLINVIFRYSDNETRMTLLPSVHHWADQSWPSIVVFSNVIYAL